MKEEVGLVLLARKVVVVNGGWGEGCIEVIDVAFKACHNFLDRLHEHTFIFFFFGLRGGGKGAASGLGTPLDDFARSGWCWDCLISRRSVLLLTTLFTWMIDSLSTKNVSLKMATFAHNPIISQRKKSCPWLAEDTSDLRDYYATHIQEDVLHNAVGCHNPISWDSFASGKRYFKGNSWCLWVKCPI